MKKLAAITLLTAAVLSLAPRPAMAGSREGAMIGGFIGGLIIGHAITENNRYSHPHQPVPVHVRNHPGDSYGGYWRESRVQVWVPGCWVAAPHPGRHSRHFVPGHHAYRTTRVWVADSRRHHRAGSYAGNHR